MLAGSMGLLPSASLGDARNRLGHAARALRADPRQRARHRRAGQGQPARGDPVGGDAARLFARRRRPRRRASRRRSRRARSGLRTADIADPRRRPSAPSRWGVRCSQRSRSERFARIAGRGHRRHRPGGPRGRGAPRRAELSRRHADALRLASVSRRDDSNSTSSETGERAPRRAAGDRFGIPLRACGGQLRRRGAARRERGIGRRSRSRRFRQKPSLLLGAADLGSALRDGPRRTLGASARSA